jgi:hypothetical protein
LKNIKCDNNLSLKEKKKNKSTEEALKEVNDETLTAKPIYIHKA